MIKEFDLHKVHKAGARFSKEKSEWFNHQYIQLKSDEELLTLLKNTDLNLSIVSDEKLLRIIHLMKKELLSRKTSMKMENFSLKLRISYE